MPETTIEEPTIKGPVGPLCKCGQPAEFSYIWPWGESGVACTKCAAVLHQTAANLGRTVAVSALAQMAPTPMSRDERTAMHAKVLAAEDELGLAKDRNRELYNANQQLANEARRMSANIDELKSQLADARSELDAGVEEKGRLRRELADKTEELMRLQTLLHAPHVPSG